MTRFLLLFLALGLLACDKPKTPNVAEMVPTQFIKEMGLSPQKPDFVFPGFSYQTLEGETRHLPAQPGKVIFLNFWATWCMPCKKEMPDIEELHGLMQGENFQILAVSMGEKSSRVAHFLKKFPYSFPIGLDPDSKVSDLFQINALPTTMVIDKQGRLRAQAIGPRVWRNQQFVDFLKVLSKEP